ncbi:MAG: hypothetical protein H6672_19010 [Anaerolineaceae bacterium]|nr:hypothetical protein [Anaerolineaceae bacterium]
MSKKLYLSLGLVGIVTLVVLGLFLWSTVLQSNPVEVSLSLTIPSPDANMRATIEFERSAIAQFTQSPDLAVSMTPFYAQIIYNEVVRNLTEIPYPVRPCYLNPTDVPENLATPLPTDKCGPFLGTIALGGDELREFADLMNAAGIVGTVGGDSIGLEQKNQPFIAVQSHLGFAVTIESISDQALLVNTVENLVDFALQNWDMLREVSTNAEIYIQLTASDGSKWIITTYDSLVMAKRSNLTGESLIQALGGWQDVDD